MVSNIIVMYYYILLSNRYTLGLMHARLILFSWEKIEQAFLHQMNDSMKRFLLQVKPNIVCRLEERYQANWTTMIPFLEAAYTYGVEAMKLSDACVNKTQPSGTFTDQGTPASPVSTKPPVTSLSLAYVMFALLVEMSRPINTELLIKQGLLDYIVILHWGMDSGWHDHCQWVQKEVRKAKKLPVPRLSSIAKGKLARTNRDYSGQIIIM